jgi:hypothetical protein
VAHEEDLLANLLPEESSATEGQLVAVAAAINTMPIPERKAYRQRIRNLAARLRGESKNNSTSSTTCYTIGGAAGAGLLTGSVVVAATSAVLAAPVIAVAGFGAAVLFGGMYWGHRLGVLSNDQACQADLIDNVAQEIDT